MLVKFIYLAVMTFFIYKFLINKSVKRKFTNSIKKFVNCLISILNNLKILTIETFFATISTVFLIIIANTLFFEIQFEFNIISFLSIYIFLMFFVCNIGLCILNLNLNINNKQKDNITKRNSKLINNNQKVRKCS